MEKIRPLPPNRVQTTEAFLASEEFFDPRCRHALSRLRTVSRNSLEGWLDHRLPMETFGNLWSLAGASPIYLTASGEGHRLPISVWQPGVA